MRGREGEEREDKCVTRQRKTVKRNEKSNFAAHDTSKKRTWYSPIITSAPLRRHQLAIKRSYGRLTFAASSFSLSYNSV